MLAHDRRVFHLIELLYGSLVEPGLWRLFLEDLAESVGATQAALDFHSIKTGKDSVAVFTGTDPEIIQAYEEYYYSRNIWTDRAKNLDVWGKVITTKVFCTDQELRRTEFYNDWLRPAKMFHDMGIGFIDETLDATVAINLMRPENARPFGSAEMAFLSQLVPHLKLARKLYRKRYILELSRKAAWSVLDRIPTAVVAIDADKRILAFNSMAAELIRQCDGLLVKDRQIRAAISSEDAELQRTIRSVITGSVSDARGGVVRISRLLSDYPISVVVSPVPENGFPVRSSAAAIVFATTPDKTPTVDPAVLRRVYKLTRAEARLAAALCQGKTLEEASEDFRISKHTARNQLKSIFLKSGTKRQSELMRLLLTSSIPLPAA